MKKFNYDELTRGEKSKYTRGVSKLWDTKSERHRLQYKAYSDARDTAWAEIEEERQAMLEAERLEQETIAEQIKALKEKSNQISREMNNKLHELREQAEERHEVKKFFEIWNAVSEQSHALYLEELEELKQTFLDKEVSN